MRQRHKFFDPPVVVIHEGDTVVWVNDTRGGWHDVRSYERDFSFDRMDYGDTVSHTFDRAGVYSVYCSPHVIDGMQATVVVLPEGAPLPESIPSPLAVTPSLDVPAEPVPVGPPDTIATVAGSAGVGGPATSASLYLPEGVAAGEGGDLYIADTENCQVRRVDAAGTITSVFGHDSCGSSMGSDADLGPWLHTNHPRAVAAGPEGELYVSDTINCRVRLLRADGSVATVAGNGSCRASGDNGPAAPAGLSPWGLAVDAQGTLYVADVFNCRVRKIVEGTITTVAGDGTCGFAGDGGPASEARLFFPRDVAAGDDGALYIADTENCRVRRVDPASAIITTVAGGGSCNFSGDGGPAVEAGLQPWGVAVAPNGDVLVADRQNCRLRRITAGGVITTVAGNGGCGYAGDGAAASLTTLNAPSDIAIAADGGVYVADTGNCRVRRIGADGTISTAAGSGACAPAGDGGAAVGGGAWHPMGLAADEDGGWYFSELDTCRVRRVSAGGLVTTYAGSGRCGYAGDGGPAAGAQLGDMLGGLALSDDGSLFIADGYNCRVRRVASDGAISTIAGSGTCGYSGDGGPATAAGIGMISDVALDGSGGLLLADPNNCRVRRVDLATGVLDTVLGDGSCDYNGEDVAALAAGVVPWGVAVGPKGTLYVADGGNCRVRRVERGRVETVAGGDACGYAGDGGPATSAQLLRPYDVIVDQTGNVYVADVRTFTVRKIETSGVITTVAGVGIARPVDIGGFDPTRGLLCTLHNLPVPAPTYLRDGSPADEAGLYFPYAIAFGSDRHLYIADTFDHRVRRVACGGGVPCVGAAAAPGATGPFAPGTTDGPQQLPLLPATGTGTQRGAADTAVGLLAAVGTALLLAAGVRLRARLR